MKSPFDNKEHLLELCQKNNAAAWNYFVKKYANLVFKKIYKTLIHYHLLDSLKGDIEDIFQETFIKIFHSIKDLRDASKLEVWIVKVAFSTTVDYMRYFLRKDASEESVDIETMHSVSDYRTDVQKSVEQEVIFERIRESISRLSEIEQFVIRMYYEKRLKYREIAAALGITEGGVGAIKHRAEQKLRKMLLRGDNND